MKLSDDDFGFSLVSESELKAHEEQLKKVVEQQSKAVEQQTAEAQDKLHGLRNMIMPLLLNLSKKFKICSVQMLYWLPPFDEFLLSFL
jgi:hypothetical protein